VSDTLLLGGGGVKSILLLDGSQAMPARPSGKDRMKVKTLRWLIFTSSL
jgi:hypothetical protein